MADISYASLPLQQEEEIKTYAEATVAPWDPSLPRAKTWSEEPRTLRQPDWIWYFERVMDIILVIVPLYFIRKLSEYSISQ